MTFCRLMELLQEKDKGYIILANAGAFYIAIGRDAILLNKIFDFKLNCMCKGICKIGFPKNSLEKYKKLLKRSRYSYIIYEIDEKKSEIKVLERYEGKLKNEIKEKKKDCFICKNELAGYTEKENKYTKMFINLRKKEESERKQTDFNT